LVSVTFTGLPIEVRYSPDLLDTAGNTAHAATYLRRRLIVLDIDLPGNKTEHRRILVHEIAHFAWVRLGNPRRWAWEKVLEREWQAGARGEAGWSAEWRKRALRERHMTGRDRAWREYCCESFCDTAAWLWGGVESEVTLSARYRRKRSKWFTEEFATQCIAI
jgi:hypothetical protein